MTDIIKNRQPNPLQLNESTLAQLFEWQQRYQYTPETLAKELKLEHPEAVQWIRVLLKYHQLPVPIDTLAHERIIQVKWP